MSLKKEIEQLREMHPDHQVWSHHSDKNGYVKSEIELEAAIKKWNNQVKWLWTGTYIIIYLAIFLFIYFNFLR